MNYQILVNKKNGLDKNYVPNKLVPVNSLYKENILLEKETYNNFINLKKDMSAKGYSLEIESGYRSYDYQLKIYNELIIEKGEEYTKNHVALPGYSEHQTGLCLDFCLYKEGKWFLEYDLVNLDIVKYIHNILHKHGFILRYPFRKEDMTGYQYEPWHIRYVGIDLAKLLYKNRMTLEEYYLNINK